MYELPKRIKRLNINQGINCFYIFTFLPIVAWLTDWYDKQKVEKESIKIKENKNHETFQQLVKTYTFMSFVA